MDCKMKLAFLFFGLSVFPAFAQTIQGPLQAQNSLSELAVNGTQATARSNITAAKSGVNSDITSLTGISVPLSASQGGTGVNNGAFLLTMFGSLTTAGGQPITLTATGTTNVTLPTSGTLFSSTSSIPNANLSPLLANQLLGALTATTPSGQSVPSCVGTNAALQWTSGVGFGCVTIASGVSSPGGVNTDVQFNNLTAFGGNSSFTYNGTGGVTVGTSGSVMGTLAFNNPTSGSITLSPPTGALGTVTDTLPLGGTLLTAGQASASFATLGANSNITSLSGLTTPLSPFQGGTGVQNANANTYTSAEPVTFTGGFSAQLTTTGATTVTLPTSGTLLNNMSTANNTILGTTSSNLINDLPIPNCVGTGSAIQWTTGTGFSCGTITGTAATPGGGSTDVQFNNSGVFGGNGGFVYDGTSQISLGVPGTSLGKVMFNSSGSGSITIATPNGALGGAFSDLLPLGGTLLNNMTGALAGSNTNITSITGLTTPLAINQGGTGANTSSGALTSLGAAMSGANSNITSLTGLTTPLSITQGGTGANTSTAALTNLGAAAAAGSATQVFNVGSSTTSTEAPRSNQTVGGQGTSYINVTGSRALATTFTNSTAGAIAVSVAASTTVSNVALEGVVNGVSVAFSTEFTAGEGIGIYFIVPPGATYSVSFTAGTQTLVTWFELEN
jgi:hypothetical protein